MNLGLCKSFTDHPAGFRLFYERALEVARELPVGLPFIEIGTRAGGSALLLLQAIHESGKDRPLITIDPYGKPYQSGQGEYLNPDQPNVCPSVQHYEPTGEGHYRTAMALLANYCAENSLTYVPYRMTSADFMDTWLYLANLWIDGGKINGLPFGLVYLDGEHTEEVVCRELAWFSSRMHPDGLLVIDDTENIRESCNPVIQRVFRQGEEFGNRLYCRQQAKKSLRQARAVVTIATGEAYEKIGRLTHPTLKAYADRIGAEFVVISESFCSTPHWEKFQIHNLLEQFDRILYLDTDLIVRQDTPDLFDLVPENQFGAFNEAPFTPDRKGALIKACEDHGLKIREWGGKYYNSGIMVLSQCHQHLFQKPELETFNFFEQSYLNAVLASEETPVFSLPYRFNRMTCLDPITGEDRQESWIVHYAGWQNLAQTLSIIRGDLARWKAGSFTPLTAGDLDTRYKGKPRATRRHILIDVQGGLGDQIQAEPAIRWGLDNIWKDADVDIKTHWPRIFQHLSPAAGIFHHDEWVPKPDTPYYQACTLPGPNTPTWSVVSNLLCHTVDFCSIALLKRTLPMEARTIRLESTPEDIAEAQCIVGEEKFGSLILVHAGWHWQGKTLPLSWWQAVVDVLQEDGFNLCLIGKQEEDDETRGVLPLITRPGMIDARNRTSLGGLFALIQGAGTLISNDSAPIHIAGAFETEIVLFPTTKAPDHLLPYRHGRVDWKARALYKKGMWEDFVTAPNEYLDASVVDMVPGGEARWMDFLPEPGEVVDACKRN